MLRVEDTVLVLLAAGTGTRFGDVGCKLDEMFLNRPLGLHVVTALEDMPFRERVAVTGGAAIDYAAHGFRVLANDDPSLGMARSIRIGATHARAVEAEALLIALADMPRVTAAHIHRLFDAYSGSDSVVASSDGCEPKPPALFGRDRFDFLLNLDGDEGARGLVRAGRHVVTSPAELIDVDTPEDMERLRELVGSPDALTRIAARQTEQG